MVSSALHALHSPHHSPTLPPTFLCNLNPSNCSNFPRNLLLSSTRRTATTAALAALFLAKEAVSNPNVASSFEFRLTAPDQTPEEAESVIKTHIKHLLNIKPLIDSQTWRDAQKALRQCSARLRRDLYTIIQAKPGSQRPQLRRLYSKLFNSVTRLDYAARSKDAETVKKCYDNIASTIEEILAMI